MDAESFTALALRVISREATDDERRAIEAELASVPARREEFALAEKFSDQWIEYKKRTKIIIPFVF